MDGNASMTTLGCRRAHAEAAGLAYYYLGMKQEAWPIISVRQHPQHCLAEFLSAAPELALDRRRPLLPGGGIRPPAGPACHQRAAVAARSRSSANCSAISMIMSS
jgi:hypothetical protein